MTQFKHITWAELKKIRLKQWKKQGEKCPVLNQKIPYKDAVMDHKHKTKAEKIGENGKGLLRGVLHAQANSWEGKVTNSFKRYGLHKFDITLPEALRNLAKYIEHPTMKPEYIHPSEKPKSKKLGVRNCNKIRKYYLKVYPTRKKKIEITANSKLSDKLQTILNDIDIYLKEK